jgi:hypothetical protein
MIFRFPDPPGQPKSPRRISPKPELTKNEFDAELTAALMNVKDGLRRQGMYEPVDLDSQQKAEIGVHAGEIAASGRRGHSDRLSWRFILQ